MVATYWERVAVKGEAIEPPDADSAPLDLNTVSVVLSCYASGIIGAQTAADYQGLLSSHAVEFGQLLATMPELQIDRAAWVQKVVGAFRGSRLNFPELSTLEQLREAVGVSPT